MVTPEVTADDMAIYNGKKPETPAPAVKQEPAKAQPHQTATLPAKAEKSNLPVALKGLEIKSLDDATRMARAIIVSGMAPRGMDKVESVLVAMQAGMEIGFSPMQAVQNIIVINGRPSLGGDAALGLVRASGELEAYDEKFVGGDAPSMTITIKRRGMSPISRSFSVLDAKRAGLWGKSGPWTQYPDRMLRYRALGFALRDTFSDVIKGLGIREEMQDIPARDITAQVEIDPRVAALKE